MALENKHFEVVANFIDANIGTGVIARTIKQTCPFKHLVVGSTVWRNLACVSTGKELSIENDIDILSIGKINDGIAINKSYSRKSISINGLKIDFIEVESIDDYFNGVPLTCQAVAYDIENRLFYGHGLQDISDGVCKLNNEESLAKSGKTATGYAIEKNVYKYFILDEKLTPAPPKLSSTTYWYKLGDSFTISNL